MDRWRVEPHVQHAKPHAVSVHPTYGESLWNYFRGWRYPFFGTIFIYVLMVLGWIGLGGGLDELGAASMRRIGFGLLGATMLLFGIFLINDAADRHVDARVHPDRPIPQGKSAWQHIMATAVALLVGGALVSTQVNRQSLAVASAMTVYALFFYGWAKSNVRVPGSSEILTPVVSAMFPLYGLSIAGCTEPRILVGAVGYIYLADFSQDMLGGIHDQEGDRVGNVRTFALALGARRTLILSAVVYVLAALTGASLLYTTRTSYVYAVALGGVSVAMIVLYGRLFRIARKGDGPTLLAAADRMNHLAGMFFFIVAASTFLDHVVSRLLHL